MGTVESLWRIPRALNNSCDCIDARPPAQHHAWRPPRHGLLGRPPPRQGDTISQCSVSLWQYGVIPGVKLTSSFPCESSISAQLFLQGQNWEEGFSTGLLNSLCIFPLLSYGATAPLADIPEPSLAQTIAKGWDEAPVGRRRLQVNRSSFSVWS